MLGLTAASVASAQAALERVDSGKVVRARIDPARTVRGRYIPIGDGSLGIRSDRGGTDTLRLAEISELAVRGRHTKTGAIVGGTAGVAFGLFLGVLLNGFCEGAEDCSGAAPYLITIPAFGSGGALLGAAIGSAFPNWKRVYP